MLDLDIRLYGQFAGVHSLSRVANGFRSVFPEAPRYDLSVWGNDLDDLQDSPEGVDAKHAIFLGPIRDLPIVKQKGTHKYIWVMLAPNSNEIGSGVQRIINENATHVMTPSRWACDVLEKFFPRVVTVPHGISSRFGPRKIKKRDVYTVLHLSSTRQGRKGTKELIQAWKMVDLKNAELLISVPSESVYLMLDLIEDLGAQNVRATNRLNFSASEMASLYSSVHLVCQPSRGEGFGFVPLEARACGTPVAITGVTGHSEHVVPGMPSPGVFVIPTGSDQPLDDLPGSVAPSLYPAWIAESLEYCHEHSEGLISQAQGHSRRLREEWSWENKLRPFKELLKEY